MDLCNLYEPISTYTKVATCCNVKYVKSTTLDLVTATCCPSDIQRPYSPGEMQLAIGSPGFFCGLSPSYGGHIESQMTFRLITVVTASKTDLPPRQAAETQLNLGKPEAASILVKAQRNLRPQPG